MKSYFPLTDMGTNGLFMIYIINYSSETRIIIYLILLLRYVPILRRVFIKQGVPLHTWTLFLKSLKSVIFERTHISCSFFPQDRIPRVILFKACRVFLSVRLSFRPLTLTLPITFDSFKVQYFSPG